MRPKLVIHGGAGRLGSNLTPFKKHIKTLSSTAKKTYGILCKDGAKEAVRQGVMILESAPELNAGFGSLIQSDGVVRMSASIMDTKDGIFSGVINIQDVEHPIDVAAHLAKEKNKVLGGNEATNYARSLGMKYFNPITQKRWAEYLERKKQNTEKLQEKTGTVGVVALDEEGYICAGTSTGGTGFEIPGRISDSPTVAGNYAYRDPVTLRSCGVSCTGIGEQIVDLAVAAKLVALVTTAGWSLEDAVNYIVEMADKKDATIGLISIDSDGNIAVGTDSKSAVLFAKHDGKKVSNSLTKGLLSNSVKIF